MTTDRLMLRWLAAAVMTASPLTARAQEFIRPDCRSVVQASTQLKYESELQANWYRRFWTGDCAGLPKLRCMPGSPNWNGVVSELAAKVSAAQRAAFMPKACKLGQTMGLEWARAKNVQRISTADLKAFLALLKAAPDTVSGLDRVSERVQAQIAGR